MIQWSVQLAERKLLHLWWFYMGQKWGIGLSFIEEPLRNVGINAEIGNRYPISGWRGVW